MDDYDRTTVEDRAEKRTEDEFVSTNRLNVDDGHTYDTRESDSFDTTSNLRTVPSGEYKENRTEFDGEALPTGDTEGTDFRVETSDGDKRYDTTDTRFGVAPHNAASPFESEVAQPEHDLGSTAPHTFSSNPGGQDKTYADRDEPHDRRSGTSTSDWSGRYDTAPFGGAATDNDRATKSNDSAMGKMMEKAGEVLKNETLAEKGREKRETAESDQDQPEC